MTLAVARNPYATNVPDSLIAAAARLGVPVRPVDLPSLRVSIAPLGELSGHRCGRSGHGRQPGPLPAVRLPGGGARAAGAGAHRAGPEPGGQRAAR